ncbi:S35B1 protein, partial [Smithornis capensis]|nr:S35B1 protein [Smithornis capensis]
MGAPGTAPAALPERLRLPVCFLGVFACYFYYGILQESITRGRYGEGAVQEQFRFALTLVFIQCVINAAFAKIRCAVGWEGCVGMSLESFLHPGALPSPQSNIPILSPVFPSQVLGKSCKPIPGKDIPICGLRCSVLNPSPRGAGMGKGRAEGELTQDLCPQLLSLTLDGLTGVSQDHMRAHYQTGSNHMMLNVNLWSTLFLGAGSCQPGCVCCPQSFIFMTVVYFGPLTCSIITTTRKFFTILASVVLFANPISSVQWVGTILVFLGLGLDAKFGKGVKKTSH